MRGPDVMRRAWVGSAVLVAIAPTVGALGARTARAQEPTASAALPGLRVVPASPLTVSSFFLLGEPSTPGALSPWAASTPMRLSLRSTMFPTSALFPNCDSRMESVGNSSHGAPVQRYTFLQLVPGLTLHGFSSAGCPVDAAIGGAVTYSVPLRPSLWLVAGAGIYGTPAHPPLPARQQREVRIDVTRALSDGRTLSVGVGRRGLSIGGVW